MHNYSRSFWIGLSGFILGGIIGALTSYLLFTSGLLTVFMQFFSPGQPFIRYLFGIVLAFLGVGLGGALDGLVCGYTLHRIDHEGSLKRYLLGGAFSTGISQGILVVPILLFISLVSMYNVGSQKDPASFITLFAIIGGLFGLLNGAILSLITVRIRYAWIIWLGFSFSSLVGGVLFGLLVWRSEWILSVVTRDFGILTFLLLPGATIYGLAGGILGIIYHWLHLKRTSPHPVHIEPARWQDSMTVILAIAMFVGDALLINTLAKFVTIFPGNITTSLSSDTEGVQWMEPIQLSSDVLSWDESSVDLAGQATALVSTWSDASGEIVLVFQRSNEAGRTMWNAPINVSGSPQVRSLHPQVALGNDRAAHVVWSEDGAIWYNRCKHSSCDELLNLTQELTACQHGSSNVTSDWPVIALADDGRLMVAWQVREGVVGYVTWDTSNSPSRHVSGCLESRLVSIRPRLAISASGEFWMAISGTLDHPGPVSLIKFHQGNWAEPQLLGEGSLAEVTSTLSGDVQVAWCSTNLGLIYLAPGNSVETIHSSSCRNRPSIFQDRFERIHLVYGTDRWHDNFGNIRTGKALMESIRQPQGWTEPAITTLLSKDAQQDVAGQVGDDIQLAWIDADGDNLLLWHSIQPDYQCDELFVSGIMSKLLTLIQNGSYHPVGYQSPFCGNHFEELIYLPKPEPEFAILPEGQVDGFDQIADLIAGGRYEVLFSIMQWDKDKDNLSPGSRLALAIANLYQQVKANPEAYPRGLTIKILLGNYPNLSTLQMGDQIWNVFEDLADMGLETMEDPRIGWKVEVANYKGAFPHSHTKFIVLDGKTIMAAGFNVSWDHLSKDDPSGKGIAMADLGIVLSGPVAQTGITVFDEMWQGANQLACEELVPGNLRLMKKSCTRFPATVSHVPEVLRYNLTTDSANTLATYRSADYKEADEAMHLALASADSSIDAIQANFTGDLICDVNLVFSGVCTYENALPYMRSIVEAIENNGAYVRLLVERENMNGLENQVGVRILREELARLGFEDHLEVRFFKGRVHTKAVLIDDQLLIVGSQNFHYSSISEGGVTELNIVTDSPEAVAVFQDMFEHYWQEGTSGIGMK